MAKTTRVCAYDRAGYGWSSPGPQPRDSQTIADELHALLTNAGLEGPYVLVGHSFGGLHARMFAARYPDETAGMVLVDASHPEQWTRMPPEVIGGSIPEDRLMRTASWLSRLGVTRLAHVPAPDDLPEPQRSQVGAFVTWPSFMDSNASELRAISQSNEQVAAAGNLGDKPLVVLTALGGYELLPGDASTRAAQTWAALQAELAGLSTNQV